MREHTLKVCPRCRKRPEIVTVDTCTVIRCPDRACRIRHHTAAAADTVLEAVEQWDGIWRSFRNGTWRTRYRECQRCSGTGFVSEGGDTVERKSDISRRRCRVCSGRGFIILSEQESRQLNIWHAFEEEDGPA